MTLLDVIKKGMLGIIVFVLIFVAGFYYYQKKSDSKKHEQASEFASTSINKPQDALLTNYSNPSNLGASCISGSTTGTGNSSGATLACPVISGIIYGGGSGGGANGANGSSGANGSNGTSGTNGRDGTNGTNGANGKDGLAGTNGKDGATGPQGPVGPAGPQGPAGENGKNGTYSDNLIVENGSTYSQSGGLVNYDFEFIGGSTTTGTYDQTGGTNHINLDLNTANSGGNGWYNLSGEDSVITVDRYEHIGVNGSGYFNQSNGTHTVAGYMLLGGSSNGYGEYNMSGGSLTVGGNLTVGSEGNGTFNQTDGYVVVNQYIGSGNGGSYYLNGGSESAHLSAHVIDAYTGEDDYESPNGLAAFDYTGGQLSFDKFIGSLYQRATDANSDFYVGRSNHYSTITGNYDLETSAPTNFATIDFDIEGTSPGVNYDSLDVTGVHSASGYASVVLDGYIQIYWGSFDPEASDTFDIILARDPAGEDRASITLGSNFEILGLTPGWSYRIVSDGSSIKKLQLYNTTGAVNTDSIETVSCFAGSTCSCPTNYVITGIGNPNNPTPGGIDSIQCSHFNTSSGYSTSWTDPVGESQIPYSYDGTSYCGLNDYMYQISFDSSGVPSNVYCKGLAYDGGNKIKFGGEAFTYHHYDRDTVTCPSGWAGEGIGDVYVPDGAVDAFQCTSMSADSGHGTAVSVTIEPAGPINMTPYDTQNFTATAHDSNGNTWDVTNSVTWHDNDPYGYFYFNTYNSLTIGTWTVFASLGAVNSNNVTVNVYGEHKEGIALNIVPVGPLSMTAGQTRGFNAYETDEDGVTWDVTLDVDWHENDPDGSFSSNIYTAMKSGSWTVYATINPLTSNEVTVNVDHGNALELYIDPAGPLDMDAWTSQDFTAYAYDVYSNSWDVTSLVEWHENDPFGYFSFNTYNARTMGGPWTIYASLGSLNSNNVDINVNGNHGDVLSLDVIPVGPLNMDPNDQQNFTAIAHDGGNTWDATNEVTWYTDDPTGSFSANTYTAGSSGTWTNFASLDLINSNGVTVNVSGGGGNVVLTNSNVFHVWLDVSSEMALTCDSGPVLMLPDIGGIVGGVATGSTNCNVATSNAAGWELYIKDAIHDTASDNFGRLCLDSVCGNGLAQFDGFGSEDDPYTWDSISSGTAQFGYSVGGLYILDIFDGSKYAKLKPSDTADGDTHGFKVAEKTLPTSVGGDNTVFNFKAEFNPGSSLDHLIEGNYSTEVLVTAIAK